MVGKAFLVQEEETDETLIGVVITDLTDVDDSGERQLLDKINGEILSEDHPMDGGVLTVTLTWASN